MKKLTFTVHDCGCVDLEDAGDSDGFHIMAVAWMVLLKLNEVVDIESFQEAEDMLTLTLEKLKRSSTCIQHIKHKHAN